MSAGCPGTAAATKRIRAPAGVWRVNRRETWEEVAVPELRIVSDELWEAVRRRQAALRFAVTRDQDGHATNRAHRRAFLLSGVLTRGCCGGLYTIMAKDRCELAGIERRLEGVLKAFEDGVSGEALRTRLDHLESERTRLRDQIESAARVSPSGATASKRCDDLLHEKW